MNCEQVTDEKLKFLKYSLTCKRKANSINFINYTSISNLWSSRLSEFLNIKFEQAEGIYFDAYISDEDRRFFLDMAILEDMSNKKSISNRGVALTAFHSIRNRVNSMCISAHKENPNWEPEKPLPLMRTHIR